MNDFGWGQTLIYVIGITLIVGGLVSLAIEVVYRIKAHNRLLRQADHRLGIMHDLKDLNS
jgi:hypothetical protein